MALVIIILTTFVYRKYNHYVDRILLINGIIKG